MNVVEGLAYIRAGLLAAGLKPHQILVAMEMAKPANRDSAPSASVYAMDTRLRRESRKVRIRAEFISPPVSGAVAGIRQTLMGGLTWFRIEIEQTSMAAMQNVLAKFLEHVIRTDLVDAQGNVYAVLTEGEPKERELIVNWNDHASTDRTICTFDLPLPGIVWRDHPLVPIEIVVEYALDGGSPDE